MNSDEVASSFFDFIEAVERLGEKTDQEIGELIIDHVMADMIILSPQYALMMEVLDRLGYEYRPVD